MEIDFGRNYQNARKKRRKSYPKEVEIVDNYSHLQRGKSIKEKNRIVYRGLGGELIFIGGNPESISSSYRETFDEPPRVESTHPGRLDNRKHSF